MLTTKLKSMTLTTVSNADLVATVCDFVTENCDQDTQEAVATLLGETLPLRSLNHLICHMQGFESHEAFLRDQLKERSFRSHRDCRTCWTRPSGLRGELMSSLKPKLTDLCDSSELFRSLFTLPAVKTALKADRDLEGLIQTRIARVVNHTTRRLSPVVLLM